MFKIRRAVYWQFGGLAIAVALISALSRFFPIVDFVEAAQTRVMNWGTWGAICRMPGLFLYAYVGTLGQFGLKMIRGESHPRVVEYWTWGGAFFTTALLLLVLGRTASRVVQTAQTASATSHSQTNRLESAEHLLHHK